MKTDNYKSAYELFGFQFLGFEIGANCFNIKFSIRESIWFFFKNVEVVSSKAAEFENVGYIFSEMFFVTYSRKTGNYWNKDLSGSWPGIVWVK